MGLNSMHINYHYDEYIDSSTSEEPPTSPTRDNGSSGGGGGLWGLQPPQMILRSPAHLGLKYESCPVFLTGP